MNTLKSPSLEETGDMLRESVISVFNTMLKTKIAAARNPQPPADMLVVGSIGFVGEANGMVYIRIASPFAKTLASRMLALPEDALDDGMVNDVVGEVSNMIVGSVKSQLCDSGSPCALTIPSIVRGDRFCIERTSSADRTLLNFESEDEAVLVELLMKQIP